MDKIAQKSTPSLSVSKQCRISILDSVCVCVCVCVGGGGGGGLDFQEHVEKPCFPACGKKTPGHFLTQKESACQI